MTRNGHRKERREATVSKNVNYLLLLTFFKLVQDLFLNLLKVYIGYLEQSEPLGERITEETESAVVSEFGKMMQSQDEK